MAVALAMIYASVALCPAAQASPWHLQSSFGTGGVAALPAGYTWSAIAPGPQGSLFASGGVTCTAPPSMNPNRCAGLDASLFVARVSAQGTVVPGFGRGGVARVSSVSVAESAQMFALPAGKLLIAGEDRAGDLVLTRLSVDGTVDPTFGHDGVVRYSLPGHEALRLTVAREPDGEILAVYQQLVGPTGSSRTVLVRLLSSGALDRSFGRGGYLDAVGGPKATIGPAGSLGGVTIAPDGFVLLAQEGLESHGRQLGWGVEKLGPKGAASAGFGTEGLALVHPGSVELSPEAALQGLFALPGGGIEVAFAGTAFVANPQAFLGEELGNELELFRFTASGRPDPTFGHSGAATIAGIQAITLGPGGETFAVGAGGASLVLTGVLPTGAPDPALGGVSGTRLALQLGQIAVNGPLLYSDGAINVLVNAADAVRLAS